MIWAEKVTQYFHVALLGILFSIVYGKLISDMAMAQEGAMTHDSREDLHHSS